MLMLDWILAVVVALALLVGWLLYGLHRRQVQRLQQQLDAVLRASADGICLEDQHGVVQTWSPGAQAMLGYSAQDIEGQTLQRLVPPDRQFEEEAWDHAPAAPVRSLDTVRRHQNGSLVPVALTLVALVDGQGQRYGAVRLLRDTTRQQVSAELIQSMAFNDALTGLPNWRLLRDRIWRAQLNSNRQRAYFAVLYVDVDNFQAINTAHGRAVGDQVLLEVSVRLMAAIRQNDTVARLRGDAFMVLLEDLGPREVAAANHVGTVADKIWDMLERTYLVGGQPIRCTASIGIQLRLGGNGSVDPIIHAAQAAMQQVKKGRKLLASGVFGGN